MSIHRVLIPSFFLSPSLAIVDFYGGEFLLSQCRSGLIRREVFCRRWSVVRCGTWEWNVLEGSLDVEKIIN